MTASNDYGAQVTIGGLTFNTGTADATVPAQLWYAAVVGWEGCPKRVTSLPNLHEDGDQPQFMHLAPRPLSLRGTIQVTGPNAAELLQQARDRLLLATMAHPDALVQLTVAETVPTAAGTYALVHMAEDAPQWNVTACDDLGGTARFQVGLTAPGGARYSVVEVTTALPATLTNLGNWGSPPTVTVVGPAAGPIVVSLGLEGVRADTALGAGETLILYFYNKTATINGADRRDLLGLSTEWWKLRPGSNVVTYSGGGTASIKHRHAYA